MDLWTTPILRFPIQAGASLTDYLTDIVIRVWVRPN